MITVIEELRSKFFGKKVLIVGLGLQGGGTGLAKFFCSLGAKVKITDKKTKKQLQESLDQLKDLPIEYQLGEHKLEDFLEADVIFKGPSVPWDLLELKLAEKKGIPIELEASFFASLCPAKIIGITGTRGKSTTTMMIYEIIKQSGKIVHLAGNLPQVSTINLLNKIQPDDWVVLELSSWGLSGFHRKKISPHIAVLTNFYPDHLNLYKNMDEYFYDKKAIYLYQKKEDYSIINEALKDKIDTNEVKGELIFFSKNDFPNQLTYLKGQHNLENASAVLAVAKTLCLDLLHSINIIKSFSCLPYRQQIIATKDKITFVNDTTSTTPIATVKAIEAFADKPVYLILGGNSKNLPLDQLINRLNMTKKIILLSGTFTQEILPMLKEKYPEKITETFEDLKKAVLAACELARKETKDCYILFSPGATSFAMFNNEFHRGEEFNKIVRGI